jgi:hypothetical protein
MKTGMTQGPRAHRLIKSDFQPLVLDLTLENAVIASIRSATWLEDADLGAAQQAVLLAQTMDQMPDRRHQLAPILIGLLSNLGLMNNRRQDLSITPQEMLAQIANGS